MADYTVADKLAEVEREIAMRKRHYPGMIARGNLTHTLARTRIEILAAIANDYRAIGAPESFPGGEDRGEQSVTRDTRAPVPDHPAGARDGSS